MDRQDNIIVYASDTNYVPHMAASMLSVMETNPDLNVKFCVLDNHISPDEKNKIILLSKQYGSEISFVDIDAYIIKADLKTNFNKTAFARLFIASVIKANKALYLDCDTIVCGSLKPLFEFDLKDNLIAAVQDTVSAKLRTAVGLQYNDPYINSGVLLMNLELWRKAHIEKQFISCIEKFNGNVPHNDQGIINAVCCGKTYILDAKYNMQDTMMFYTVDQLKELFDMPDYYQNVQFETDKKNPIIIHYTEAHYGRPWFSDSNHPYKVEYLNMRKQLEERWPIPHEKTKLKKRLKRIIKQKLYNALPFVCYKKILLYERKKKEAI